MLTKKIDSSSSEVHVSRDDVAIWADLGACVLEFHGASQSCMAVFDLQVWGPFCGYHPNTSLSIWGLD